MKLRTEQIVRRDLHIAAAPVTLIYGAETGFDEFWSFGQPRMNADLHRQLAAERDAFIAAAEAHFRARQPD
ncbi:MAG TPA: hypothetical protein DD491_03900 [Halieaceae bacterium]|nr:hypothetical protein [Halieaceae bacterium]|tara:strand:+ start:564 stop:776 length:213 start_codon:yes stop_codon:yes gene_type:complete